MYISFNFTYIFIWHTHLKVIQPKIKPKYSSTDDVLITHSEQNIRRTSPIVEPTKETTTFSNRNIRSLKNHNNTEKNNSGFVITIDI